MNDDDVEGTPDLACGAFVFGKPSPGGSPGFVVPAALLRNAHAVANAIAASRATASDRAISVELNNTERRRAHTTGDGPERFLRLQACPFTRPHIGSPGTKYFIELNLATPDDRDRAVCRSPWSWIGRRMP